MGLNGQVLHLAVNKDILTVAEMTMSLFFLTFRNLRSLIMVRQSRTERFQVQSYFTFLMVLRDITGLQPTSHFIHIPFKKEKILSS